MGKGNSNRRHRGFDDDPPDFCIERKPSRGRRDAVPGFLVSEESRPARTYSTTPTGRPAFTVDRPRRPPTPVSDVPFERATVKSYKGERGFGFVTTPQGDLFFHVSVLKCAGIEAEPTQGMVLEIQRGVNQRDQKPCVIGVRLPV